VSIRALKAHQNHVRQELSLSCSQSRGHRQGYLAGLRNKNYPHFHVDGFLFRQRLSPAASRKPGFFKCHLISKGILRHHREFRNENFHSLRLRQSSAHQDVDLQISPLSPHSLLANSIPSNLLPKIPKDES